MQGKIHTWAGADETFYLDGAVDRLQTALENQGSMGNALFLKDIVILDLSAHPRVGIIDPKHI